MTVTAAPSPATTSTRRAWIALGVLSLPLLLVSMDVSILYFAAPSIVEDLHATATQQLWIFDVYGFVLAGMLVTMGALADRLGARRVLLVGALAFGATSVAAALSQSAGQLIAARGVLGLAGATLMPSTLAMVRTMFTDERDRAKAVAAWTGIMTAGVGLGPVIGGLLLRSFSWGSVFLVNVPAMVLLLVLGPLLLPRTPGRRGTPFDLVGSVLSLAAVLPTVYGIKEWAAHGYELRWMVWLAVGIGFGALLARRLTTHTHPLVAPALLRNRSYAAAISANAVATFALVGNAIFMTAYLQLVLDKSALAAALWSLVPTAGVALATPLASALAPRVGRRPVMAAGFALAAVGFVVLTRVGTDSLIGVLVGAGVLASGLVAVMTMAAEQTMAALRPEDAGAGSAVSEAATELGGALGIALLGSIGAAAYRDAVADRLPATLAHGPAGDSLAGATSLAEHLPATVADAVLAAARASYVHGLHVAAICGAAVLVLAAVAAVSRPLNQQSARTPRG